MANKAATMIRRSAPALMTFAAAAACLLLLLLAPGSSAFVSPARMAPSAAFASRGGPASAHPAAASASAALDLLSTAAESSSVALSASTFDPSSALSAILGGLLGSPAIILVPVFGGVTVAAVVGFFLVWSAKPEVDED